MSNSVIRVSISQSMRIAIEASLRKSNKSLGAFISDSVLDYLCLHEWPDKCHRRASVSSCVICGAPLPEGNARYCSDECKREGHRRSAVESLRRKRLSQSQPPED